MEAPPGPLRARGPIPQRARGTFYCALCESVLNPAGGARRISAYNGGLVVGLGLLLACTSGVGFASLSEVGFEPTEVMRPTVAHTGGYLFSGLREAPAVGFEPYLGQASKNNS